MPSEQILSQDEIDALLGGIDDGELSAEVKPLPVDADVQAYDFSSEDRIVQGSLPGLDVINERFRSKFRSNLSEFLQAKIELGGGDTRLVKFSEYSQNLHPSAYVGLLDVNPLDGNASVSLDPPLVYALVDVFFGGTGRAPAKGEAGELTTVQSRIVAAVTEILIKDLIQAWETVVALDITQKGAESNPRLANIAADGDVVVANMFPIEVDGQAGELSLVYPYSMLEPIREKLDSGGQDRKHDEQWTQALRAGVEEVELQVVAVLTEKDLSLLQVRSTAVGEVVYMDPTDDPSDATARVGSLPVFEGSYGASRGRMALKVTRWRTPS